MDTSAGKISILLFLFSKVWIHLHWRRKAPRTKVLMEQKLSLSIYAQTEKIQKISGELGEGWNQVL